jgi:hypothetical protein
VVVAVAARRVSAAAARASKQPDFDRDTARAFKRPRFCFSETLLIVERLPRSGASKPPMSIGPTSHHRPAFDRIGGKFGQAYQAF